jgi:pantetheine-phosphate adenylyltransferase
VSKHRIGLYPGTFDPITLGHVDIILRAAKVVDKLVIGVAINRDKGPLFDLEERVEMVKVALDGLDLDGCEIEVKAYDNLLMHFAMDVNANVIVRGLRAVSDFEYEYQMVGMNNRLNQEVQTLFLMAADKYQFIASRLVKEIARLGGDVSHFVSPTIAAQLYQKYGIAKGDIVKSNYVS